MVKTLFISPHNDDEALFGSFIIQQELPEVWVVLDGITQRAEGKTNCTSEARRQESIAAVEILLGINYKSHQSIQFFGDQDYDPDWNRVSRLMESLSKQGFSTVYAPYPEPHPSHHKQHNQIGILATKVFPHSLLFYTTYTRYHGKTGTSTPNAREWKPTDGLQIQKKLRALACYKSQMDVMGCREHFMRDLREYVVEYRPGEMWWEK